MHGIIVRSITVAASKFIILAPVIVALRPFNSLGCEHGLMEVIAVDTMYIYYGSKKETINGALVGLITGKLSTDGEYTALINSAYAISGKV